MPASEAPSALPPAADIDAVTDAVLTASRLLVAISARSIAAVDESITLPQFRLLVVLANSGPLKLADLAGHLGVAASSATRAVDRLLATEFITRTVNPASRREAVVALTAKGRRVVRRVTDNRRKEIARIVERMPAGRRRGLIAALTAFTQAGGEPPVTRAGVFAPQENWI